MSDRPTLIERAFQLACTGRFNRVEEIRMALNSEGYFASQLDGPALEKQLREAIKKARPGILGKAKDKRNPASMAYRDGLHQVGGRRRSV